MKSRNLLLLSAAAVGALFAVQAFAQSKTATDADKPKQDQSQTSDPSDPEAKARRRDILADYILNEIKKAERIFADETTLPAGESGAVVFGGWCHDPTLSRTRELRSTMVVRARRHRWLWACGLYVGPRAVRSW